jgi:Mce-associated membrane protein
MTADHDGDDAAHADAAPAPAGSAKAAPGKPGARKSGSAQRPRWLVPTAIALVIGLVAALVATAWFGIKVVQGFSVEQGRSNAVSAAKDVATNFTTYDVGTVDADAKRLVEGVTPRYAAQFDSDKAGFLARVHSGQVKSTGEVTEAGVLSYDQATNTAHILVTVRATVASKEAPGGEARAYRLDITMIDTGDWRADRVEFVT